MKQSKVNIEKNKCIVAEKLKRCVARFEIEKKQSITISTHESHGNHHSFHSHTNAPGWPSSI